VHQGEGPYTLGVVLACRPI